MTSPNDLNRELQVAGVEEARKRLPELFNAANADGTVTIVTKRGTPFAAIVPVSQALGAPSRLTELRGSAQGCYGEVADYVGGLRNEWRSRT